MSDYLKRIMRWVVVILALLMLSSDTHQTEVMPSFSPPVAE